MDTDRFFAAGFARGLLKQGSVLEVTDPGIPPPEKMPPDPPMPSPKRSNVAGRIVPDSVKSRRIISGVLRALAGGGP